MGGGGGDGGQHVQDLLVWLISQAMNRLLKADTIEQLGSGWAWVYP